MNRIADQGHRGSAATLLPAFAIAGAGLAARTPLAETWPRTAALLFLWIVADALVLSRMARAPDRRPGPRAILAALAAAGLIVAVGASAPVRTGLFNMVPVAGAILAVVAAHLIWGGARAVARLQAPANRERWSEALAELLPPAFARLVVAEASFLHLTLFRWSAAPDVPANARAFGYHRHLAPLMAMLLVLQVIEASVTHVVVAQFSPRAALILLGLSLSGLVYMAGLIKSLRLRPVLVTPEGIRVRTGVLVDRFLPFSAIAGIDGDVPGEEVRHRATLNAGLLAWPNIMVRLADPLPRRPLLRARPAIRAFAFRVDDPAELLRCVAWQRARLSPASGSVLASRRPAHRA